MPARRDLHSILVLGSGPIVIGQAGEFDYSGTQGCTALRDEGYRVVLANSNPATIMTDPDIADRTYVAPLDPEALEVMRDRADNAIVICAIENLDPMGVHTGDSVCVAPTMTLTDRELQGLRDAALTVIRAVGVETGGANVQFALDRRSGEAVVIEMNPRVSRSSALASKATGFPIAK